MTWSEHIWHNAELGAGFHEIAVQVVALTEGDEGLAVQIAGLKMVAPGEGVGEGHVHVGAGFHDEGVIEVAQVCGGRPHDADDSPDFTMERATSVGELSTESSMLGWLSAKQSMRSFGSVSAAPGTSDTDSWGTRSLRPPSPR